MKTTKTKKLKTEVEKRMGQNSVGNLRWKNRRRDAFKESGSLEQYPYYGMPVATLLELKAWEPHQKLLAAGAVRECTADDDVIFVSHQWLGFEHPDPKHDQLRALQRMIRRLLSGTPPVPSCPSCTRVSASAAFDMLVLRSRRRRGAWTPSKRACTPSTRHVTCTARFPRSSLYFRPF